MKKSIYATLQFTLFVLFLFTFETISAKETLKIDHDWKFIKTDVSGAQNVSFDDSSWDTLSLPHTWNAIDGEDGGNNYYRGIGWYRKHITIPSSYAGKVIYLNFDAANTKATVYLNGTLLGTHYGGYGAFMFDITNKVLLGKENIIAVQVDNSSSIICPPISADFNHDGGITRDVELLVTNPLHINPNEFMSNRFTGANGCWVAEPGVIIKQSNVSNTSADVKIITKIKNDSSSSQNATIEVFIKDRTGQIVKTLTESKTIAANDTSSSTLSTTIDNPHLWDGLNDPYLYRVEIYLKSDNKVTDTSIQPLGLRYFSIDPNKGFFLNGKSYPLRGISLHESKIHKGHAVSDADRKEAIDLLRETGNNYFRLSHYEHGDFTYRYLDTLGIICWTEIPNVNSVGSTTAENTEYKKHAVSAMYELLRQRYNHPSIVFWGLSNEVNFRAKISPVSTDSLLNQLVKSEDSYRFTTVAAMYSEASTNWIPDVYGNNRYDGWYSNNINGFASTMDYLHSKYPNLKIGVSEYGAGANPAQHEYPAAEPSSGGQWHPEEYQNKFHETYLKAINARPYLWGTSLWIGIDFAVDSRNEGLHPGLNDKGLISYDRTIKKDAFYWYKANWNKKDFFVYITSRRYINRPSLINPVKLYSNCDSVSIAVNGKNYKNIGSTDHIFMFDSIPMLSGVNHIVAYGIKNDTVYRDSVDWNCVDSGNSPEFPVVEPGKIQINFQTTTATVPNGYLKDDGSAFGDRGNGYSYGWSVDIKNNARERNSASDKRYDTFVHMQVGGTYSWSIYLPNGKYKVSIASGDPGYTDSYHRIEANGVNIIDFIPTSTYKYGAGTGIVDVTNDTLTVQPAYGSVNAKIDFIHISPVDSVQTFVSTTKTKKLFAFYNGRNLVIKNGDFSKSKLQIFSINGRLVMTKELTNFPTDITLSDLTNGIYVIKLVDKNDFIQSKFIIN